MGLDEYRTALITGASSGIGAALAAALADRGLEVHAVARREERLAELAKATGCLAHPLDVRDTGALESLLGGLEVDVLVNGAGMAAGYTALHEDDADGIDAVIDVNLKAVLHLLRLVVPGMLARNRGHVVNIGSFAGLHVLEGMSGYGTAKTAVHAVSQLLRVDLFGRRVRVSEICPGRVETEFHATTLGDAEAARKTFYEGYELLAPADVVGAILFALEAPPHVNVSLIELTPVMQVPGGQRFAKSQSE